MVFGVVAFWIKSFKYCIFIKDIPTQLIIRKVFMEKVISGSDTLTIFKLSKVCVERMLACKLPTVHSVRKLQILF